MEDKKTVGLNNYERKYFQKYFGNNLKRLMLFRKAISKEQAGYQSATFRRLPIKGGYYLSFSLTRRKVDAYIREITGKN